MTKYYLKYDSPKDKFFIDVYESIKRSEKDLKEYAEAVEHLAQSGSSLVFDTKDFDLVGTYEFLGNIYDLRDVVGIQDASQIVNEIAFKNNNSFRLTDKVLVTIEGDYATLEVKQPVTKTISVDIKLLEDVLKYFHPNIDGRHELKQEEILEKIKTLVK